MNMAVAGAFLGCSYHLSVSIVGNNIIQITNRDPLSRFSNRIQHSYTDDSYAFRLVNM